MSLVSDVALKSLNIEAVYLIDYHLFLSLQVIPKYRCGL